MAYVARIADLRDKLVAGGFARPRAIEAEAKR